MVWALERNYLQVAEIDNRSKKNSFPHSPPLKLDFEMFLTQSFMVKDKVLLVLSLLLLLTSSAVGRQKKHSNPLLRFLNSFETACLK